MTDARALAERVFDILNNQRYDDLTAVVTEDVVKTELQAMTRGAAEWVAGHQAFAAGVPDTRMTVTGCVQDGDDFAVEGYGSGTHTGPLQLPGAPVVPATGRKVRDGVLRVRPAPRRPDQRGARLLRPDVDHGAARTAPRARRHLTGPSSHIWLRPRRTARRARSRPMRRDCQPRDQALLLAGEHRYGLYVITRPDAAGVLAPREPGNRWSLARETSVGTGRLASLGQDALAGLIQRGRRQQQAPAADRAAEHLDLRRPASRALHAATRPTA